MEWIGRNCWLLGAASWGVSSAAVIDVAGMAFAVFLLVLHLIVTGLE